MTKSAFEKIEAGLHEASLLARIDRLEDIARRVIDLPYFKNARVEALVRDAKDAIDAGLPTTEDVRGILATPPLTSNHKTSQQE